MGGREERETGAGLTRQNMRDKIRDVEHGGPGDGLGTVADNVDLVVADSGNT